MGLYPRWPLPATSHPTMDADATSGAGRTATGQYSGSTCRGEDEPGLASPLVHVALRLRWPWRHTALRLLPTLVATPPLGYPDDVPDLLLLCLFVFFPVRDRVYVSIAHHPSAHTSSTSASTTPAHSSSLTMSHGVASDMPGDAHILFLCLFSSTSISVGSSSLLLIERFYPRHHHRRPRLARRRSGQPIARVTSPSHDVCRLPRVSSLSMRVAAASPPRATARPIVDSAATAPPRQPRDLSSSLSLCHLFG